MKTRWLTMAGALLLAGAGAARGVTVADVQLERHFWGDPLDREDLVGRVVVLYYWAAD